jgi:hypothetical protein
MSLAKSKSARTKQAKRKIAMNMHVLPTAATKIDRQDTTPRPIRDVIAARMEKRAAMLATSDEDLVHHEKTGSDHPVLVEESRALKAVFNAKPRTFREAADLLKYIVCDATGETLNTVYTRVCTQIAY